MCLVVQVLALVAMEPPVGPDSSFLQDEKAKVFAAMRPIDPANMVRGQYVGYRAEPGVSPDSTVDTFVAARLEIDSWRWAGVPWYVRCGKGLASSATEVVVEFKEPPSLLFDEAGGPAPQRNLVRFRLGKNDGVTFTLQAKTPGQHLDSQNVDIAVDFAAAMTGATQRERPSCSDRSPRRSPWSGRRAHTRHSRCTHRDARPRRRYDSARWLAAP